MYAFSTNSLLELDSDDSVINEDARKQFMAHKIVDKKYFKSTNDRALALISFIFDLNYDYSLQRVYNEKYIDKIYEVIKNKKIFKEFYEEAINYLKKRCNDVRK